MRFNSSFHFCLTVPANTTSKEDGNCRPFANDNSSIKGVKILLYSVVLIVSLFGNSVIITTVARNKHMRTTINYLIANMAASDLLISTFAVPMKLCEIVVGSRRWLIDGIAGLVLCKLVYFLQDISMAVSIQSLVVIAIDRYRGIVFPFRPAIITPKRCKIIIPLVWFTSMGLHGTYFYTVRLVSHNGTTFCDLSWAPNFHPQRAHESYVIVISVLLVILPFTVLTVLYTRIIWILRQQGLATGQSILLHKRHEENTKVIKNLCVIMVAFAFCILPLFVYGILYFFVWKWKMPCHMEQFGFAAHFVLFSNAAITPLIYFVFNVRYRKGLTDVLRKLLICQNDLNAEIELDSLSPQAQRYANCANDK